MRSRIDPMRRREFTCPRSRGSLKGCSLLRTTVWASIPNIPPRSFESCRNGALDLPEDCERYGGRSGWNRILPADCFLSSPFPVTRPVAPRIPWEAGFHSTASTCHLQRAGVSRSIAFGVSSRLASNSWKWQCTCTRQGVQALDSQMGCRPA
jgi:hypothetical protein